MDHDFTPTAASPTTLTSAAFAMMEIDEMTNFSSGGDAADTTLDAHAQSTGQVIASGSIPTSLRFTDVLVEPYMASLLSCLSVEDRMRVQTVEPQCRIAVRRPQLWKSDIWDCGRGFVPAFPPSD
jgi:hypothetical protein